MSTTYNLVGDTKYISNLFFLMIFFLQRSVTGGLGSIQAEIMADTAVALTSANVQLVSRKVIGRLCRVSNNSDETGYCISGYLHLGDIYTSYKISLKLRKIPPQIW